MKILSLTINHGLFKDKFEFSPKINMIHSKKNSVGKSTLLRFLMYSLGYPIPNIRGIDFDKCELELEFKNEKDIACQLHRENSIIIFIQNGEATQYSLPIDLNELHKIIFGTANIDLLNNLLGAFYLDQEKGWTLLNRGKAIGSIHFSIEGLIKGLSNRSCDDLEYNLKEIERKIKKYQYMFDTAQYKASLSNLKENLTFETPREEIEKELDILYSERKPIIEELERIKRVVRKNTDFLKYITAFKLIVEQNDTQIPVNEDTIVGFRCNAEFLSTKRKMMIDQLASINNQINNLLKLSNNENNLISVQSKIQSFDANIAKMDDMNIVSLENIINQLKKEYNSLRNTITKKIKQNNPIIFELYTLVSIFTKELGVGERYVRPTENFIFTNDLKSLSGAILHKIVFSFKMAYIKLIHEHAGINLPIILDSPSGREIDKINIYEMMNILSRDFTEHQIVIASINKYQINPDNTIELKDRLFQNEPNDNNKSGEK